MKKIIRTTILLILIIFILMVLFKILNIEKRVLKILYPIKYEEYVYKYSKELSIDPFLTFSIIKTESNFDEMAKSKSGAIGLMQLMESTAKEQAKKLEIQYSKEILYNPKHNLRLGLNYFNTLLDYYNQNYILAFAAYNAGIGNVQNWISNGIIKEDGSDIENIPFKETNMYVRKILNTYEKYKEIYI